MDVGKILNTSLSFRKRKVCINPKENITLYGESPRFSYGKGQMFMIAAIFMIIGFVLLKNLLSLPVVTEEKTFQDISQLDRNLKNIKHEYAYTASTASLQPDTNRSGMEYLFNLSTFVRREFDANILYVYIFSNGSTRNFSATVGNFMKNNVSGRLNVTNSDPAGRTFILNDTKNVTLEFNASSAWVNVTLNYTIQNRDVAENFYFNASTRNYVAAFFDITLKDSGIFVRSKSTYNRTWPSWQAFT